MQSLDPKWENTSKICYDLVQNYPVLNINTAFKSKKGPDEGVLRLKKRSKIHIYIHTWAIHKMTLTNLVSYFLIFVSYSPP